MENMDVRWQQVERARLTELQKDCLVRFYVNEESQREIAGSLGKSQQAVAKILSRARACLKRAGLPIPHLPQHRPKMTTGMDMNLLSDDGNGVREIW